MNIGIIKICLLSYLILNITGQTNDLNGKYIFSSAWSGTSTSINSKCFPTAIDVDAEAAMEYGMAYFDWEFPDTPECQNEGFSSEYDTEAQFYGYESQENHTDVTIWKWGPSIGTYYSFAISPYMNAYFYPNKSMIIYLDNEESPALNYLFIANFSTYQEDNYSTQANGSLARLEDLQDIQDVNEYIAEDGRYISSLQWLTDPELPELNGEEEDEINKVIADDDEDINKLDNIKELLKKGLTSAKDLEDLEFLEYLESIQKVLKDDEEEINDVNNQIFNKFG